MAVALFGGCDRCGRYFINPIDYSKKYRRWEEKYFFGMFISTYNEESLCSRCLPIIEDKFSVVNIRKKRIKKIL